MKILVCISSVPDTTSKINFTADKSAFDKNGIQWVINPLDEFALTKAVKLQESQGATVTVINVGDAATEPVIRKALAIGANDAVTVPGMVAQLLNQPFVNASVGLDVNGSEATAVREIEGGKETISVKLPAIIAGQKGLVDEKDLIIPNMRGIMSARTKPLQVVEPTSSEVKVQGVSYDSVPPRAAVKMVSPDNLDELVRLLHEEANVI